MSRFETALEIAREVSSFLRSSAGKGFSIEEKALNDYVTDSDRRAETMIRERILKEFPDDEILGEEYGVSGASKRLWIIDPIDGTVNYMNHFPFYTVSIAYEENGETVFGIVSVPEQGEIFYAKKGEGAYLNSEKISVSTLESHKALAILVPPHRHHEELDGYLTSMRRLYEIYSDVRSIGSAALSLCYLASGRVSCYYERLLHLYDIAAGLLIAKEAGAEIALDCHDSFIDVIATSQGLLEKTRDAIDG